MNSSSRVRKGPSFTKRCIMDALLQLMHTKDYDDITITDILKEPVYPGCPITAIIIPKMRF